MKARSCVKFLGMGKSRTARSLDSCGARPSVVNRNPRKSASRLNRLALLPFTSRP